VFTGIIREMGKVKGAGRSGGAARLTVSCASTCERARAGDSVSVNGVCLTVTDRSGGALVFDVMDETMRRTSLGGLSEGEAVNLEPSLVSGQGIDGHFVLGHVDCVGKVRSAGAAPGHEIVIEHPKGFDGLLVEKGSVAVDGVSLTVGRVMDGAFSVYAIPYTLRETTIGSRRPGDAVNLEFDIIGKHIAKLGSRPARGTITEEFLKSHGF
jgi:riboflavin synthase